MEATRSSLATRWTSDGFDGTGTGHVEPHGTEPVVNGDDDDDDADGGAGGWCNVDRWSEMFIGESLSVATLDCMLMHTLPPNI